MTDLILYTTEDGRSQIKLRADQETVWLTRLEMAELFDATKQNISLHLKNIFEDGELDEGSVVKESLTTAADGKRYQTLFYNLDAILDASNLRYMRLFYLAFPNCDALRHELSWTHYRLHRLVLPTEEELRRELERDREEIEARQSLEIENE